MKPEQIRECADQLVEFHKRLAPLFYEKRQAHWCYKWLHGPLLDGVRKNAAKLARAVPGANVQAMQQFITDSPWDHRKMIAELQLIVADLREPVPSEEVLADDPGSKPDLKLSMFLVLKAVKGEPSEEPSGPTASLKGIDNLSPAG